MMAREVAHWDREIEHRLKRYEREWEKIDSEETSTQKRASGSWWWQLTR